MTKTATKKAHNVYMHPHHGIATVERATVERVIDGRVVRMRALRTAATPAWSSLVGIAGGTLTKTTEIRSLVPAKALTEGGTLWSPCPNIDLERLLNHVRTIDTAPWVDKFDMPMPTKMAEVCAVRLSRVQDEEDVDLALGEIVAQIGDYLSTWHTQSLRHSCHATEEWGAALGGTENFWSSVVGRRYAVKSVGRDMIVMLGRVTAIAALGSSTDTESVACQIDAALSDRTRRRMRSAAAKA